MIRNMKHLFFRATAICLPFFAAALLAMPTHAISLSVVAPTPVSTFAGMLTEYTATFTSATAINGCTLSIDGVSQGDMTMSGSLSGTATRSATISSAGSHLVRATCINSGGSTGFGEATVTVTADTNAPVLGAYTLTPAIPVADSPFTIQSNYDDTDFGSGLNTCYLNVDAGIVGTGSMTLSGGIGSTAGTANRSTTVTEAGTHTLTINCYDRSGNLGTRTQSVIFVAPIDTTNPVVSSILPISAISGVAVNVQAAVSDNIGVNSCALEVNGVSQGGMTVAAGLATKALIFSIIGDNAVKVTCLDAAGNSGFRSVLINVGTPVATDTTAPTVTSINPSTTVTGSSVIVSASFSDAIGATACNLYVNGSLIGSMDRSGTTSGTATRSHTFGSTGTYVVEVRCSDAASNTGSSSRTITVTTPGTAGLYANHLVKLVCPAGFIDVNHPCKAVYFVSTDGKRHAFPNERVYFTWYTNFDGIIELNGTTLSGITLGANVTYRPGVRMVKFTTLNKVYAVGRYGSLRWVTTEAIATSLYGSVWNTHIDDISDTFYTDYTFGSDVTPTATFNPSAETSGVSSIDANLR